MTLFFLLPENVAGPATMVSEDTAQVWTLSANDVLDDDIVSSLSCLRLAM